MDDTYRLSAGELADAIGRNELSATEAVASSLARIDRLDPHLKAFVSVRPDLALRDARRLDTIHRRGARGPLHGVPIAVKDVTDVAGFPTTHGSLTTSHADAAADELSVARLRAAGAIVVGKTNTPEFGFGAVCSNRLVGLTLNPWDTNMTSGGSSGGSAVAVTTGMVPLAQGTDFGGSVRTPASFCGCYGLRPTPGLIPEPGRPVAWGPVATQGVLSRTPQDADLMLSVMAGEDVMDPGSRRMALRDAGAPLRVAASVDLDGAFRVDPQVRSAFAQAVDAATPTFGRIERACPQMKDAVDAFQVIRAVETWPAYQTLTEQRASELTESFVWNVRRGKGVSAERYIKAQRVRSAAYRRALRFFDNYDILMLPSASVLPFPNSQGEVVQIDGERTDSIIEYLACTFLISVIGFPALSVPAVWTNDGLPFGIQLVTRPDNEALLIRAATALAKLSGFRHRFPPIDTFPTPSSARASQD